jgi:hypothetical protein
MTGFSEHRVMLCLDRQLYTAFIKLQADKNLGRSYAGLLPYVEGLYRLGYITKEVYDLHFERYSVPLIREVKEPLTLEQKQKKDLLEQKNKYFLEVIEQFALHSGNAVWLDRCHKAAEPFKDQLESARTLLDMIDKSTVQSKGTVQ